MPKVLFYSGTAFLLFLALTGAAESARQFQGESIALAALDAERVSSRAPWAIVVALVAGLAAAAVFLRMAALVAARNLFGAFLAIFSVTGAISTLSAVLLLQSRLAASASSATLTELHFVGSLVLGYFVSLSLLSLRPYFRVQASRFLSALVFLPLPLFALILLQEIFAGGAPAALPAATPASLVYFAVLSVLFFSIAVHCIRHRHLFLEMTNLRELLDGRVDPLGRPPRRSIGGVAFDS
ncbi:MAG TPA: hypothetical protein VMS98_19760 [Thermoanaerobaculia bacterium]|nr:hypothetical protein [Thermoanaerobaculia bacterium]